MEIKDNNRIAIFIDAENLTGWLKTGGAELLLEELSTIGQAVVRRAYGIWTNLTPYQAALNRLGFELIHSFHPVKGKNSTDIQMTVDIMEYVWRVENINWFVLATGDSDFSPLFRRLREMGKDVIGVGPRSALSESVKSSCSRFIYTDVAMQTEDNHDKIEKIQSAFDDAANLVEKVIESFEGPIQCSLLKSRMRNIDSAFDEKLLGFTSFTKFLQSIEGVKVYYDDDIKSWHVSTNEESSVYKLSIAQLSKETISLTQDEIYRNLLRKKHWQGVPKETLLSVYHKFVTLGALPRRDITEKLLESLDNNIISADIKKAMSMLFKAKLITIEKGEDDDDAIWKVDSITDNELFIAIDKAMIPRLITACKEKNVLIEPSQIKKLLFSSNNGSAIKTWIQDAKRNFTNEQAA